MTCFFYILFHTLWLELGMWTQIFLLITTSLVISSIFCMKIKPTLYPQDKFIFVDSSKDICKINNSKNNVLSHSILALGLIFITFFGLIKQNSITNIYTPGVGFVKLGHLDFYFLVSSVFLSIYLSISLKYRDQINKFLISQLGESENIETFYHNKFVYNAKKLLGEKINTIFILVSISLLIISFVTYSIVTEEKFEWEIKT